MSNPQEQAQDPLDTLLAHYSSVSASGSVPSGSSGPEKKKEYGYEYFKAILESTPIFMKETPKDGESNDVLEALRTLVFDGEGDEVATNFKNHGNELHLQKSYSEAIKAYTQGLDSNPSDLVLKISLLNNRAQCNLLLKNYRSVLKDTATIIALYTTKGMIADKPLIKGMYRTAVSLVALERWKEALDVIQRAQAVLFQVPGEDEKVWEVLKDKVAKGLHREQERVNRIEREKMLEIQLNKAVEKRGLINVKTGSPPDNPNPIHFDPEEIPLEQERQQEDGDGEMTISEDTPLIFPVFLLYPQYGQSDFISNFQENTSFLDQMRIMFPESANRVEVPYADWDEKRDYRIDNLVIYVETSEKRLLKVGKELTLREIIMKARREANVEAKITKDGIVLRDGLLSFVVLPKGPVEKKWIDDFKKSRDGK
ncbi:uncharacterized protein I303_102740 [Kwoniella dejecticola CBS 10117]|uniref:Cns1/TTC4 wheel domain-containing protein n=1 Tax=Kwoniella dejecticola CBS 10117 TaxID=1296121 RepID=A0A1A6A9K7_9TREE|nr:uncharacterized protein I303_02755 [Kwoniella dejecticola CBS 10117]OBR86741.1 hypothetical protein I303_02755 [Kwoniella dejecticola CBS 10117]